jgi:hypothetical protein
MPVFDTVWHAFDTEKAVYFVRLLSMFCHRKKPVFCTTFELLLFHRIISKKPCVARVFAIEGSRNHNTANSMCHNHAIPSISADALPQPQDSIRSHGIR